MQQKQNINVRLRRLSHYFESPSSKTPRKPTPTPSLPYAMTTLKLSRYTGILAVVGLMTISQSDLAPNRMARMAFRSCKPDGREEETERTHLTLLNNKLTPSLFGIVEVELDAEHTHHENDEHRTGQAAVNTGTVTRRVLRSDFHRIVSEPDRNRILRQR